MPPTPRIRAIIFDLDGVLADSEPWWNQIDAQLLKEYGADYHGEYHRDVLGVSYRLAIEFYKKAFGISASTEEIMKRRGEIATEFFANSVDLFPRAKDVLEELRQMKLNLALATSSVSASARPFLDRHQLTGFFEVIVAGDEIERGKPEPDIYLRTAEKLGVSAAECLVIEDSLSGIAAAKAAKMRVAAIPDRRFVDPRDYEKEADYLLNDLAEIPSIMNSQNTQQLNIEVNLPAALAKLDRDLQRLVDLVSIGVIGVRKVEQDEYGVSPFPSSQQLHPAVPYDQAKGEYVTWVLRNAFAQAIDHAGEFLEQCRLLATLHLLDSKTISGEDWNRILTNEREAFDRKFFPDKIKWLREKCGATFQFEEHVLTLNQARNCLVHRLGVVSKRDTKDNGAFTIKWHCMRLVAIDSVTGDEIPVPNQTPLKNESTIALKIGPVEKQFSIGDRIELSSDELNYTMWTFHSFALEVLQAIERLRQVQ